MSGRGIAALLLRPVPEAGAAGGGDTGGMQVSYDVRWRVLGPRQAGRLCVGARSIRLVALGGDGVSARDIPFDDIREIDFCRPDHVLAMRLRSGETIEIETTVERWIFDALAAKVGPARSLSEEHEPHPGLGL